MEHRFTQFGPCTRAVIVSASCPEGKCITWSVLSVRSFKFSAVGFLASLWVFIALPRKTSSILKVNLFAFHFTQQSNYITVWPDNVVHQVMPLFHPLQSQDTLSVAGGTL